MTNPKIQELERRLLAATNRHEIQWERAGYSGGNDPNGSVWTVELKAGTVRVTHEATWIGAPMSIREAQYPAMPSLYAVLVKLHAEQVGEVVDRIMADLDRIEEEGTERATWPQKPPPPRDPRRSLEEFQQPISLSFFPALFGSLFSRKGRRR